MNAINKFIKMNFFQIGEMSNSELRRLTIASQSITYKSKNKKNKK